jgi:hypothetical protein
MNRAQLLFEAVKAGDEQAVKYQLIHGANTSQALLYMSTHSVPIEIQDAMFARKTVDPLIYAIRIGDIEFAKYLLDNEFPTTTLEEYGCSVLSLCQPGSLIEQLLLTRLSN